MFTGLIEETGRVVWLRRSNEKGVQLQIAAPLIGKTVRTGESVAVNGCCLTVASHRQEFVTFDLLQETLDRTNLRLLRPDSLVNLERALLATGRLGGHFVQGHVDCAVRVVSFEARGQDHRLELETPDDFAHYLAFKGSIAINGVSLTVAEVLDRSFAVWIIPHTRNVTSLRATQAGDVVNLEFDLLAKYVERMMLVRRA
ncbi:riboflavin synthase subunit alpha [Verrucomicrobia bacterium SCGC AG-212-E04]|nr:riboflavin synthase subunit alpha [Verrucomicrobia bacterium SCGC AG-212-E04]